MTQSASPSAPVWPRTEDGSSPYHVQPVRCVPFILTHLACLLVFWTGASWAAVLTALFTYYLRAFGLTAGYHRYFSHRAFKTSRAFQFLLAAVGNAAAQMGPLWWAAHHRHHHGAVEKPEDVHSPVRHGFLWAHMGWILSGRFRRTDMDRVPDWGRFGELRFLDRYYLLAPLAFAVALYLWGEGLDALAPSLGTSGPQMVVWAFFVSTVLLYHTTFAINSVAHVLGRRRFDTPDNSRNSLILSLLTMGEGWHNNHHQYPSSERQGIAWWEIDLTHYILVALSWIGVVWDIRRPPVESPPKSGETAPA